MKRLPILNGAHVGITTAHPNLLGSDESLKIPYIFYDDLVVTGLRDAINLHYTDSHGDYTLAKRLEILLNSGYARDLADIVNLNNVYNCDISTNHALIEKISRLIQIKESIDQYLKYLSSPSYKSHFLTPSLDDEMVGNFHTYNILQQSIHFEFIALNLREKGYNPENAFSLPFNALEGKITSRTQCIEILFDQIPIPGDIPWNELADLKQEKPFIRSIKSFRKWSAQLLKDAECTREIESEIKDSYEDFEQEMKKQKIKQCVGSVKFVLGNIAGFIEDIVKLRLESAIKRPFEITEKSIDFAYKQNSNETSPFYFTYKLHKDQDES